MATVEEQVDSDQSPRPSGSTGPKSSANLERQSTLQGAALSAVNSGLSSPGSPATTTPPDAPYSRAGSEPPKLTIQPGNAFSIRAFRGAEEYKLPKKSPGTCCNLGFLIISFLSPLERTPLIPTLTFHSSRKFDCKQLVRRDSASQHPPQTIFWSRLRRGTRPSHAQAASLQA